MLYFDRVRVRGATVTTWPNWVDLVIVIIFFRTCYNGLDRGLVAEFLTLIGAVSATALSLNYFGVVRGWIPVLGVPPYLADLFVFWAFFLILVLLVHMVLKRVTDVIKWERLHWALQGFGLVLGGLRGFWWATFLLIALTSSGFTGVRESVEKRSVIGPGLLPIGRMTVERVIDRFPGAENRGQTLIPPIKPPPS